MTLPPRPRSTVVSKRPSVRHDLLDVVADADVDPRRVGGPAHRPSVETRSSRSAGAVSSSSGVVALRPVA